MPTLELGDSPYLLDDTSLSELAKEVEALERRVVDLRTQGVLTDETLRKYYGERRFEQVAESNAIEGSTLSAGETELAVLKGITLTGHDPGYVRDAQALDKALQRLVEMARNPEPTDILQIRELHELIMEGRRGAGEIRREAVRISGSEHRPPKTWEAVMRAMESLEQWSASQRDSPAIVRATVLQAWLAHIHPFLDGNGRTARAISNLELVRAGYPPLIVRKKERDRYIDALQESDKGGDIGPFFSLMLDRADGSITGLELAAAKMQDYSRVAVQLQRTQTARLGIWNRSVDLLRSLLLLKLEDRLRPLNGEVSVREYPDLLELEEYITLCQGKPIKNSWNFEIRLAAPGVEPVVRLAWTGYRSRGMQEHLGGSFAGPSVYWSRRNTERYPPWIKSDDDAPCFQELTVREGVGDEWHGIHSGPNDAAETLSLVDVADRTAKALVDELVS